MSSASTKSLQQEAAAIPSCALNETGRREQGARYMQLGTTVARLQRTPEALLIEFDEHLDRGMLESALAVERECCPFFVFALDDPRRSLKVSVREPEQLPALEAIAAALDAGRSGRLARGRHSRAAR